MDTGLLIVLGIIAIVAYRTGFLSKILAKVRDSGSEPTKLTGHATLDLMVEAATEKYKAQPRVTDVINDFAGYLATLIETEPEKEP